MNVATLVLGLLLLAGGPTAKDVIPAGMRHVKVVLTVDAKAFPGCLCRAYQIAKGDTFAAIATRECGDAGCSDEIRLLNPQVKGEELRPGDWLRVPPRGAA